MQPLRSVLICHKGDLVNEVGLARWIASFSELVLIVRINEPSSRAWKRVRREMVRVGKLRMLDVIAYRVLHAVHYRAFDRRYRASLLEHLKQRFPGAVEPRIVDVANANDSAAVQALKEADSDFAIARCKQLLAPRFFEQPTKGVWVLHPGICPEYRNAHGGFWAIANQQKENVGTTLLRIDRGVDTGPIFGYFRTNFDETKESPFVIQDRTLFDNLDEIRHVLLEALTGAVTPIDPGDRASAEWGQPWFSAWWRAFRRKAT